MAEKCYHLLKMEINESRAIMHVQTVIAAIFLVGIGIPRSETRLSGNIGGMSFDAAGNPYIVSGDIVIQRNASSTIKAGCVFLFNDVAGMIVEGDLTAEGTPTDPIVFTTINDSSYSDKPQQLANPFDWKGIIITKDSSKVIMSNFILAYSVYGIKSEKEEFSIENGIFKANGQFNLTVRGSIEGVTDNYPYSYSIVSTQDTFDSKSTIKSELKKKKESNEDQSYRKGSIIPGRKIAPILIGATGVVSGVVCAIYAKGRSYSGKKYRDEKKDVIREELKAEGNNQLTTSMVTGGISIIALPTATILYFREKRKVADTQNVSLIPLLGYESLGMLVTLEF